MTREPAVARTGSGVCCLPPLVNEAITRSDNGDSHHPGAGVLLAPLLFSLEETEAPGGGGEGAIIYLFADPSAGAGFTQRPLPSQQGQARLRQW